MEESRATFAAKRVEARLVPLLGPTIPKAWHKTHVCLRAFKAALERAPPLPEAELRRALLGLTNIIFSALAVKCGACHRMIGILAKRCQSYPP